jgi:integrase
VKSLGTPDKATAEITALQGITLDDGSVVSIGTHKAALLAARPVVESTWQHKMEPGREHVAPEGGKIVATDKELIHISHNGSVTLIEPNGGPAFQYVSRDKSSASALGQAFIEADFGAGRGERPKVPTKNGDDAIIETYLEHRRVGGYNASEARAVWQLYKQLTDSKPLKDADRDDGRKLVKHFMHKGLKSATIEKKIAWLNAAVNLAIKENKLKFNPFGGIIPRLDDAERRLPLDGADMKVIRSNLKRLDNSDQLLLRILAATGMRLAEAYGIDSEQTENRCRFVTVGTKNEQSQRRVPLPAAVLEYLPKKITGPLFVSAYKDPVDAASKRLNRFLRDCGISDPRKVLHSLRHRAQDRLRAAGCPEDVRWAILGHEEETVAAGYGEGFPVSLLRKWIDKIGC